MKKQVSEVRCQMPVKQKAEGGKRKAAKAMNTGLLEAFLLPAFCLLLSAFCFPPSAFLP